MKEQLQRLRKSKGLTQDDISKIIDVSLSTYQKYERDVISPPYDTLIRIADFYKVTTDYLLGRDTGEPEPMEQLAGQFNMCALEQKILDNYLSLPDDMRCDFMEFLRQSVREVEEEAKSGE